jgi:hypothetical protein
MDGRTEYELMESIQQLIERRRRLIDEYREVTAKLEAALARFKKTELKDR